MSDIKCPYCNKTLHCGATLKSDKYLIDLYQCANPECESTEFLVGCKEFWDILGQHRRTRKALDVAVDALKRANNTYCAEEEDITIDLTEFAAHKWQRTAYQMEMPISIALEQITALEQKDK